MVIAKAVMMEVTNYYYSCSSEVKVVVENVGLWQPFQAPVYATLMYQYMAVA